MYTTYFRSSSYNAYDVCQQKYFITYNLGIQDEGNKSANKGTVIHKVMEVLAHLKKFEQENPTKKFLLADDDIGSQKVHINKFRTDEYINSLLEQSYDYYTNRCQKTYDKDDWGFCEEWTYEALNFNNGEFDPRNQTILYPEQHFDITFEEDWAKYEFVLPNGEYKEGQLSIKGTIDLLTLQDENTIETIDYKTGARKNWATGKVKTYEYLEKDPQLLLYYYAIRRLYPEYDNVMMTIYFIRDGGPFTLCYDDCDEEYFLDLIKKRFKEIQANKRPKCVKYSKTEKNKCWFCAYKKNNWPGTNTSICDFVEASVNHLGMDTTIEQLQSDDFTIDFYSAPGA